MGENHITYLLGAGASADCLPVVNDVNKRLKLLITHLKNVKGRLEGNFAEMPEHSKQDLMQRLIEDFEWLDKESGRHASIDTFAKKLFIKDSPDLVKLKHCLSAFFGMVQINTPPDKRYDAFFASIIKDKNFNLPDNISILSWNYDDQLEIAFTDFADNHRINDARLGLNSFQKGDNQDPKPGFGICKLNGTCGFIVGKNRRVPMIEKYEQKKTGLDDESQICQLLSSYILAVYPRWQQPQKESSVSFAWENPADIELLFNKLAPKLKNTTSLVIIGYRFPYFNRTIDKRIFQCFKKPFTVYYQSKDESKELLYNRVRNVFPSLERDAFDSDNDIYQFHIPFDF